jgi:two-component system, NtrC family, nitrogen regulation response regulator GlnG
MSKTIGRLAPQDVNVLILGESGTGKELVARALHRHSRRADRPYLAINCAALPESLIESELFGHERGAFTGAVGDRAGKFEQVEDGTILLDEIGDLPLASQAKMLRLLQDQTFERVGGNRTLTTRVRVLAATNQHLEQLIAAGKFRGDLFYRLNVVTIHVPPLRDRREDIPELAHYFLHQFAREHDLSVVGFAPEVLDLFQLHPWPGNVRELQGAVKEAALRTTGRTILPEYLPRGIGGRVPPAAPAVGLGETIDRLLRDGGKNVHARVMELVERELLVRALGHTHGHQANASDLLGINRTTLRNKLRELGIVLDKVIAERPDE